MSLDLDQVARHTNTEASLTRFGADTATVEVEFDPAVLFAEIVRELVEVESASPEILADAILAGIDQ